MTAPRTSYVAGAWTAISAPGGWLLVDLTPDTDTVRRVWELLSGGSEVEDVLDALVAQGLRAAPSFGLLHVSAAERRIVVRGDTKAVVHAANSQVSREAGSRAWVEEAVPDDAVGVTLTNGGTGAFSAALPLSSGITMAAEIRVTLAGAHVDFVRPPADSTASIVRVSVPEIVTAPVEPVLARAAPVEPAPVLVEVPPVEAPPEEAPPAEAVPAEPAPTAESTAASYDYLFGATQRPPRLGETDAEPDPAPAADEPPADIASSTTAVLEDKPVDIGNTAGWNTVGIPAPEPEPVAPAQVETSAGLIDDVPWSRPAASAATQAPAGPWTPPATAPPPTPPAAAPPPPPAAMFEGPPASASTPPPPAPSSEEVTRTTNRAALIAAMKAAEEHAPIGPTVLAGRCPVGHLSAAHAAECRVCGAGMPGQEGIEIARPPLGVLRLDTGDTVTLDRGVLLGRAPEAPADAEERPHLLRVVSPENDVSRNHAEIVLDGWHVYVRDLASTNGTTVTLPGGEAIRLRDHDLQLLEHGAVVTLADEVSCVFEVRG